MRICYGCPCTHFRGLDAILDAMTTDLGPEAAPPQGGVPRLSTSTLMLDAAILVGVSSLAIFLAYVMAHYHKRKSQLVRVTKWGHGLDEAAYGVPVWQSI